MIEQCYVHAWSDFLLTHYTFARHIPFNTNTLRMIKMTKAQFKYIQSLSRRKYRTEQHAYLVEGEKCAREWLMSSAQLHCIVAVRSWLEANGELIARHPEAILIRAEEHELERVSNFTHAQKVLLVAEQAETVDYLPQTDSWQLYLDKVQDPGNMGTIIRIADWFGIRNIFFSPDCVEIYNPKVIQASMGSLLRVGFTELNHEQFLYTNDKPIYATSLTGHSVKAIKHRPCGVIAIGNEGRGLSEIILQSAQFLVMIPRVGGAESLNVSVATGIMCSELILS